ncbi:hypothetical protein BASA81_004768 [Batrachochytrium salamandrivorans]|nr:hypothetical protein BASA81_004768 [Batrachochytrium salamandrivorans]
MSSLFRGLSPFSSSREIKLNSPPEPEPITLALLQRMAEFTPVRLSETERKDLDVIEGALDHSEYTSNVDVSTNDHYVREDYNKERKIERELHEFCQVMLGLSAGNDYQFKGKRTLGDSLRAQEPFFAHCLEVGRRFKILNPDKFRDSYGKLLYILMDSVNPSVRNSFKLLKPVETVSKLCEQEAILNDPALVVACQEITHASPELSRKKLEARQFLVDRYPQVAMAVMGSLEDALSFWRSNRDPVDKLITLLHTFFDPNKEPNLPLYSLSLQGRDRKCGHKLSHDHRTQFTFVFQTLMLWKQVMNDFFRLWIGAENDLLASKNGYSLVNTGQGLQRCQRAPETARNMNQILSQVQSTTGSTWVGLSVVHLGDREVPNALIFIDKYTQIPRIIAPIVQCINAVLPQGELYSNPQTNHYLVTNYGSPENCATMILSDLFRGGFDGSGDLGGSCIDGRLTSLWNWSSLIEKKSYYPVFLLSGFLGFDGKF